MTSLALLLAQPAAAETVTLGIGTQDTTTNTVTAGVVIRQLHLLEKYLPKDGKYANIKFELEWQNFTSGPPVTNAMMANKLQIGMMGDYPLIVNGFTFDSNPESKSRLIGIAAYSLSGSGNGHETVRAESLRAGDVVLVETDDLIPADGEVVAGVASGGRRR